MVSGWARTGVWVAGGALALAATLIISLPYIASTQIVRDRIAFEISAWVGHRVELGMPPEIEVWPFRAVLRDVTLSGWYDPDRRPVLSAERLTVELSPLAALRGEVVLSSARLVRATLRLDRIGEQPMASGGRLARSIALTREILASDPLKPDRGALPFDPVGTVEVVDGRVVREVGGVEREVLTSVTGRLEWPALNRPAHLGLSGIWRGESFVLDATAAEPLLLLAGGNAPLKGSLDAPPAGFSFDGVASLSGETFIAGAVRLASPSLARLLQWSRAGPPVGADIGAVSLSGRIAGNLQRLKIENAALALGDSTAEGVLDLSVGSAGPAVAGTLAFDQLELGTFLKALTPLGGMEPAPSSPILNLDIRLSAEAAGIGALTLRDVAATLQTKPTLAAFDISDATVFGGRVQAGVRLDRKPERPVLDIRMNGTDLSGMEIAAALPAIPLLPDSRGRIALALKGEPAPWSRFVAASEGTFSADFGTGKLPRFDLTTFLARLERGGFLALTEVSQGALPLESLGVKATITRGVARIETATIVAPRDRIALYGLIPYSSGGIALSAVVQSAGDGSGTVTAQRPFFVGGSWSAPVIASYPGAPGVAAE